MYIATSALAGVYRFKMVLKLLFQDGGADGSSPASFVQERKKLCSGEQKEKVAGGKMNGRIEILEGR